MLKLYGLKNCDGCRKARKWLDAQGLAYEFIDYRADKISVKQLQLWVGEIGVVKLINKSSTSWRSLSESEKSDLSEAKAVTLLQNHISLVKRPLWERGSKVLGVGFTDEIKKLLKQH